MKILYFTTIFLLCLAAAASAQNISVSMNYLELACLNTVHKIPVNVTGEFKSDNKFQIQLRQKDSQTILTELPAVLKEGKIEVVYQDSTLSTYGLLQLRVVSSSPKAESNWSDFKIHSKGIIRFASAISDTTNAGEDIPVKFTVFSSTSVLVTLNEGTRFEISPYSQSEFVTYDKVPAGSEGLFHITQATNACGAMRKSGEIKAVINSTSLRTTSVSPFNICENSEMKIAFSTVGTQFPATAKFRVRFRSVPFGLLDKVLTTEAPAELKDGFIVTRFPQNLNLSAKTQFKVSILAENPGAVGSDGGFIFTAYPKASVVFYTPSATINIGEETRVGVIFKGEIGRAHV